MSKNNKDEISSKKKTDKPYNIQSDGSIYNDSEANIANTGIENNGQEWNHNQLELANFDYSQNLSNQIRYK